MTTTARRTSRAHSVAAWTPAQLTNLVAWWDASDTATISVSTGNNVAQWSDKSGNGRHLVPGPIGSAALTGTRTRNGLNVVDLPGATLTYSGLTVSQPCTLWLAAVFDAALNTAARFWDSSNAARALYDASNGGGKIMVAGGTLQRFDTAAAGVGQHVICSFNGASSQMWVGGSSVGTGNPGSDGFTSAWRVGADNSAGAPLLDAAIFEMALTSSAPSAGDRTSWSTYMARWSL